MNTIVAKENIRLDILLQKELKTSRNQVENFIKTTGIKINDKIIFKSGYKVKKDDIIEYELKDVTKSERKHEINFDVEIIHEDSDLLVLNKPPFVTIHPAPSVKEATLVDWLKSKNYTLSNLSGEERLGIVHRLDKETSGAIVVAKNNSSHANLSHQLSSKTMGRYYLAIIDTPLKEDIVIEKNIARNPKDRLKMLASDSGKYAKTSFKKLLTSKDGKLELIAAKLYTGRTHQIRAHLKSINRHILADFRYGFKSKKDKINRIMLHAYTIYFTHPSSGKELFFKANLFDDMKSVLEKYFDSEELDEKISTDYIFKLFNL